MLCAPSDRRRNPDVKVSFPVHVSHVTPVKLWSLSSDYPWTVTQELSGQCKLFLKTPTASGSCGMYVMLAPSRWHRTKQRLVSHLASIFRLNRNTLPSVVFLRKFTSYTEALLMFYAVFRVCLDGKERPDFCSWGSITSIDNLWTSGPVSCLELLSMLTYCVRNVLSTRASVLKTSQRSTVSLILFHSRGRCSTTWTKDLDQLRPLLQLCMDRYYISPGQTNAELFGRGMSCSYGPLGMELRRNLLEQWWHSVTSGSKAPVFGINTLSSSKDGETDGGGQVRMVESEKLKQLLQQDVSKELILQDVQALLQRSPSVRTHLLQGKYLHNIYGKLFNQQL